MNRTKTILAIGALSVLFGWAGLRNTTDSASRPTRAISALLDYDGSLCATNCEYGDCRWMSRDSHKNELHPLGNDDGFRHSECWATGGCALWHSCDPQFTLAPSELDIVVDLLAELPAEQIVSLHETAPNVVVNVSRSAVQVLGCEGAVLASIALTADQERELSALGDA